MPSNPQSEQGKGGGASSNSGTRRHSRGRSASSFCRMRGLITHCQTVFHGCAPRPIMSIPAKIHARPAAILALIVASACWGLSFPIMHALSVAQSNLLPGVSSWFISSWCLTLRFLIAALLVGTWYLWRGQLRGWTRLEIAQAVGLGIFTACGMLLQMDGLSYTSASSSAFITQSYCFFLHIIN